MKLTFITLFVTILMVNCNNKPKDRYQSVLNLNSNSASGVISSSNGKQLMENNCYACHNPKTSQSDMIAPPMIAVKMHYISENTTEEEFINSFLLWTKEPSEENSKMPGAIKKFGLMPYQHYSEETIRAIAHYIYNNEIEEPEWFGSHHNEMHDERPGYGKRKRNADKIQRVNTEDKPKTITEQGMLIASTTKAELGKKLMGQVQRNGVSNAIKFCNLEALSITDSMARFHNVTIKRVSDRYRNPKNIANYEEIGYINTFKKQITQGDEISPIITETNNEAAFYYPIITNSMCLKCHGKPHDDIATPDLNNIMKLYPNDNAFGYDVNEVRGIWSIHFNSN